MELKEDDIVDDCPRCGMELKKPHGPKSNNTYVPKILYHMQSGFFKGTKMCETCLENVRKKFEEQYENWDNNIQIAAEAGKIKPLDLGDYPGENPWKWIYTAEAVKIKKVTEAVKIKTVTEAPTPNQTSDDYKSETKQCDKCKEPTEKRFKIFGYSRKDERRKDMWNGKKVCESCRKALKISVAKYEVE